jgi:hypothetical protein
MEEQGLEHNLAYIEQAKKEGAEFYDIGPDFRRRAVRGRGQANYEMERKALKGYPNYHKMFKRTGKKSIVEP